MNTSIGCGETAQLSRRQLLKLTLGISIGGGAGLLVAPVASAVETACADPDDENGLHESLHYSENSPDPDRKCGGCAFFTRDDQGQCGHCTIMNGRTNVNGHCDSWGPKK